MKSSKIVVGKGYEVEFVIVTESNQVTDLPGVFTKGTPFGSKS